MEKRYEMRFAGSGGQGIILASVILAEAAVLSNINAVQSQSYGPEARGGMCRAELVISKNSIWFSKVTCPNFLLAMTQKSLDQYSKTLAEEALVIADASLTVPETLSGRKVLSLPILRAATERVGKGMTANIVAIGAINKALRLFDEEILFEAVRRHIPKGTEALNEKALRVGEALISEEIAARFSVRIA